MLTTESSFRTIGIWPSVQLCEVITSSNMYYIGPRACMADPFPVEPSPRPFLPLLDSLSSGTSHLKFEQPEGIRSNSAVGGKAPFTMELV